MASIHVRGLDDARAVLAKASFDTLAQAVCLAVATEVQDFISPYPGQNSRPQPFTSGASRRAFFAKLRSGEIQVPYRRGSSPGSEQLGRRWRVLPRGRGAALVNTASYAALVHGSPGQAAYHQAGGWKTEDQARQFAETSGAVAAATERIVRSILG
jgi:hypothetical protein